MTDSNWFHHLVLSEGRIAVSLFVGVDVGGTTCTLAIGDSESTVLAVSDQFPTRSKDGPDATIADILAEIKLAAAEVADDDSR